MHESLQTVEPALLYLTDRKIDDGEDSNSFYGVKRSDSIAFGHTTVSFGKNIDWSALKKASEGSTRDEEIYLEVTNVKEGERLRCCC